MIKEGQARKWSVPLALAGLGALGFLVWSERGRRLLDWVALNRQHAVEWNEVAQRELDRIPVALNRVAESLHTAR